MIPLFCNAQNPKIDSLENVLLEAGLKEQDRVDILNSLSFQYHRSDINKGMDYANEAFEIAKRIGYREGVGDAYHKLGVNYWEKGSLDSALVAYEEAILIYDELELIEPGVRARMNKAIIFENKNELEAALHQYARALELIELYHIEDMGVVVSFNMGLVYNKMGNWTAAIERYFTFVDHAQRVGNPAWEASAWQSIGNAYVSLQDGINASDAFKSALSVASKSGNKRQEADAKRGLGRVFILNEELDSAYAHFQDALAIQTELGRPPGIALNLKSLGEISQKKQRYAEALEYQVEVVNIYRSLKRPSELAMALIRVGETNLLMNNTDEAESYLTRGNRLLDSLGTLQGQYVGKELMASLYEKQGDYAKAFKYQKAYSMYKDSVLSDSKIKELGQLEAKYEYEQEKQKLLFDQETERLRLEKEKEVIRTQLIAVSGGLLLLFISIGIIIKAYRERTLANQKLQQLDQFKTRLFANINHDLRTPLTLIQGYLHNILSNQDDYLSTQTQEALGHLSSNAHTLTEMTNEIHDLILLEEGKLELRFQEVEMNSMLRRQVLMFGSMAEMAGIDLKYESQVDELIAHIDKSHFEKILYNLLSNAFRFTSKGGQIAVGLREENKHTTVSISDTGKGIDLNDLPNIFDRFYQSPLNEYRSKEGFGIGLAVVRELVELHDGRIDVESELGKGTTFTITLPLNLDKGIAPTEENEVIMDKVKTLPTKPAKGQMVSSDADKPTILVVDDYEEIREYIICLIDKDYRVLGAANGKEALAALQRDKVDLILTDLMMPWLDGYDLIEKLKENQAWSDIQVMVVSARTTEEDKHRVLDAGVNEFISKPFDPVMLQKRIKNLLADKSKLGNTWETIIADKSLQSNLEGNILKKLNQIIVDSISDSNLTIEVIANELSASRSKTIRLIKDLTHQTPLEYIKTIRMDYIQQAIRAEKVKNATEAASAIGMSNATQFSKQYRQHFGKRRFPQIETLK